MHSDVLIIGAGPTGLVLSLWLTKLGVKVRIVDKTAEPGTTSRALAVHARTLELYRQLDLADFVVEHGHKVPAVNLWVKGEPAARLPFATLGEDLTAYPFLQIFPQDQHERLLIERLERLGVTVERQTELIRFTDEGDRVTASLADPTDIKRTARQPTSPAATARARWSARLSAPAFPAEPIAKFSTSPTSRRPVPRSTASCTSTSTKPTSLLSSRWPAKAGLV